MTDSCDIPCLRQRLQAIESMLRNTGDAELALDLHDTWTELVRQEVQAALERAADAADATVTLGVSVTCRWCQRPYVLRRKDQKTCGRPSCRQDQVRYG